jgi:predicted metal-dependent enzyme (double-stranded beta helix superfamily)
VLFERRLREGIGEGRIVLTFRRWNRCQVVAGHRYRTGSDIIEVDAVDLVTAQDIDAGQASEAGYATVKELVADLRGDEKTALYRVRFHRVDEPDPRDELAAQSELTGREIAALTAQLTRMDNSGSRGPWTSAVLTQIADHPATVSTVLAGALGWERQDFKLHVRRLKQLGLTISLDVGYRLSPRGEAYLQHIRSDGPQ